MPAEGGKLYNWKKKQLSKGDYGLDAMIRKENAANESSTMWAERKAKLQRCIVQKKG
jgi:hypothetical protein